MLNNIKIIQGTKEITLNINVSSTIDEVIEELTTKLPKLKAFYQSATTPIRVTGRLCTELEMKRIEEIIKSELDVEVKFDDASDLLGLHLIRKTFETDVEISETKYIRNSIRSGQREEYTGSLVILGDINAGAEVIAGGNIVVVGKLRGLAHAGANGNTKAIIAANGIEATQIRIANMVKEIEENDFKYPCFEIGETNKIELV